MPLILLFGLIMVLTGPPLLGADKDPAAIVESLANLRFDELGHPQIQSDSVRPVRSSPDRPHRLLIIPVQFSDLRFERFRGEADAGEKNRRYLQELLFSENLRQPRTKTLTHYYHHQSRGRYFVTGTVFSLVTVDKPLSHYGRPSRLSDGEWRNDNSPESLVEDAFRAAYAARPDFPWGDFDAWDPTDYDGDGISEEPDGYIDHFVLVYAGKGQSSCQGLYKLSEKFTANAPADLVDRLSPRERECADRIWPHRYALSKNLGRGPTLEGITNDRGGIRVREGLWVYDYNMQSEYTSVSTFIHEFGHSLGLPDIYARRTNNSTAAWDAMSSTAGRYPQELSAWSRMMLGWLEPCVLRPPEFGGAGRRTLHLKTMNDWSGTPGGSRPQGLCDAVMVILPPKVRALDLGPLTSRQQRQAVYTGQGNEMNRYLSRTFDLTEVREQPILEFDLWFEIEGDYDYLYMEASTDGLNYQRLLPTDKDSAEDSQSIMPSRKGHDGDGTLPGFTGRSGDLDADGKVESAPGCDPSRPKQLAEDRVGGEKDPCEIGQWIRARFDLSAYRGKKVEIRFHYFTDMAAVEAGALIDNVKLDALGFSEDFEGSGLTGWEVEGFSLSGGVHRLPVPHFYVLEYRDPWQDFETCLQLRQHHAPRVAGLLSGSGERRVPGIRCPLPVRGGALVRQRVVPLEPERALAAGSRAGFPVGGRLHPPGISVSGRAGAVFQAGAGSELLRNRRGGAGVAPPELPGRPLFPAPVGLLSSRPPGTRPGGVPPGGGRTASGTPPVPGPETDLRIHAHQRVLAGTGPGALPWNHQPGRHSSTKKSPDLSSVRSALALLSLGGRAFRTGAVPGRDRPLSRGPGEDGPLRRR